MFVIIGVRAPLDLGGGGGGGDLIARKKLHNARKQIAVQFLRLMNVLWFQNYSWIRTFWTSEGNKIGSKNRIFREIWGG